MQLQEVTQIIERFVDQSPLNRIRREWALCEELAELQMYEPPLIAVGDADDRLFESLKQPHIVGDHLMMPREWLPEARSVISVFLPFSDPVVLSNRENRFDPSPAWLHARYEGQVFISELTRHLCDQLSGQGYAAVAPLHDPRYWSQIDEGGDKPAYTSNWSERHAAYVCGLGTFGLSRGLITRRGMAGRFTSVITSLPLKPTARDYIKYDEYCTYCGVCVHNCPSEAISAQTGKDKARCAAFLNGTRERHNPRYGCGKCQVDAPCERRAPGRRKH